MTTTNPVADRVYNLVGVLENTAADYRAEILRVGVMLHDLQALALKVAGVDGPTVSADELVARCLNLQAPYWVTLQEIEAASKERAAAELFRSKRRS